MCRCRRAPRAQPGPAAASPGSAGAARSSSTSSTAWTGASRAPPAAPRPGHRPFPLSKGLGGPERSAIKRANAGRREAVGGGRGRGCLDGRSTEQPWRVGGVRRRVLLQGTGPSGRHKSREGFFLEDRIELKQIAEENISDLQKSEHSLRERMGPVVSRSDCVLVPQEISGFKFTYDFSPQPSL